MRTVYLDNAASSWPKPEAVNDAFALFNRDIGANPGRSGHRFSIDAGRVIYTAREKIASLFGAEDSLGIIFTKNATEALNLAVIGLLHPGDHVIVSGYEHNALMRPLRYVEKNGVSITVLPSVQYSVDPDDCVRAIRKETKAIYCLHASNVTGAVMPISALGKIARERGILFCVDASQSAGVLPIDVTAMNIDLLAFTGHKALCGPQGTGGLVIRPGIEKLMRPVLYGGTGSRSEFEEQPDFLPDMFEAGTPNSAGIAALSAGIDTVLEKGISMIREKEKSLTSLLLDGIQRLPGITIHGPDAEADRIAVVSFTADGLTPSDISFALDEEFGIMTRPGLHCAPSAHRSIGTFPEGTARISLSSFTNEEEILYTIDSLNKILKRN